MLKLKFRFRKGHRDSFSPSQPFQLKTIFLNITEYCNLRCYYCHTYKNGPLKYMSLDLIKFVLDQAVDFGKPTIILTGGEPFLHPFIEDIMKGCLRRDLPCKIATNGTLLDDHNIELLLKYKVKSLQISLDTLNPQIYSYIKGVNKTEFFNKALYGVQRCVETNQLHVVISSVANNAVQAELDDLLRYCYNEGIDTFTLYHLIPHGRALDLTDTISEADFINIADRLMGLFYTLPEHWAIDLGTPWAYNSSLIEKWHNKLDIYPVGCVAGKSSISILANGDIVPCVCVDDKIFSCGDIKSTSLKEIWNAPIMRYFRGEISIPSCKGCNNYGFCLGGCRSLAYSTTKCLEGSDLACQYWKKIE